MIGLRYNDPAQADGYRWSFYETVEEALVQAAHDQARDGRDHNVGIFLSAERVGGIENGEVILRVAADDDATAQYADQLAEMTKTERARLEAPAEGFDPDRLIGELTPSEFDRLRASVAEASR